MPMNDRRFLLAVGIAPLTPIVAIVLLLVLTTDESTTSYWIPIIVSFGLPTSYLGTCVVGLPLVIFLKRGGRLNLVSMSIAGAVSGGGLSACFSYFLSLLLGSPLRFDITLATWGAGLGIMVAITFGLLAGITSHSSSLRP